MTAPYRIGDILLHAHFGKGVVLKLSPGKCTVWFQDKERLMASANERIVCFRSLRGLPVWLKNSAASCSVTLRVAEPHSRWVATRRGLHKPVSSSPPGSRITLL